MAANPASSPGVFVWGHVFQRGELPLYIYDPAGNPASPSVVTYTIFYQPKSGGCLLQAGPSNRTPVNAAVGEYYVSGIAGECGQPGDWIVRWHWQETTQSPVTEDDLGFKVYDSSQFKPGCGSCGKTSCCCSRFSGWSCRRCGQAPCCCGTAQNGW